MNAEAITALISSYVAIAIFTGAAYVIWDNYVSGATAFWRCVLWPITLSDWTKRTLREWWRSRIT